MDELLERVAALVPGIAGRAAEAERLRRLPDATMAELRDTGVYRAMVPERLGGGGRDLRFILALGRTLGQGCTSTAWVTTFLVMHNWLLAMFPDDVVAEVFGDRGYALAPAALSPTGTAVAGDGGYRISGRWSWATGSQEADAFLVTGVVDTGGMPDLRMVLLDPAQVTVEDVWHTDGMRGTASNDVVVDEAFVPAARTLSFFDLVEGGAARANGHDEPLFGLPLVPTLCITAAAPLLGGAEGALEAFRARLAERVLAYSLGERQAEKPAAQMRLALAEVDIRAALLLLADAVEHLHGTYLAGGSIPRAERSTIRMAATRAVHLGRRAVTSLGEAAGGSAHLLGEPLQRYWRDLNTGCGHAVFDEDRTAEMRGRIAVGLEPGLTDML